MSVVLKMIIQHINTIITEYSLGLSIFFIFASIMIYITEKIEFKKIIFEIKEKFLKDYSYKWKVLFFTYLYFMLKKSLLDRSKGMENSLEFAFKRDWIFLVKDTWSKVQAVENILFFIPFSFFLVLAFFSNKNIIKLDLLKKIIKFSFLLSLFIELIQLFSTLGTFQISDIVYNTLGGFIGYILVILVNCINKLKNKLKKFLQKIKEKYLD